LALLPGSRMGEIRHLLPVFLGALELIARAVPGIVAVIPAANAKCRAAIECGLAELVDLSGQVRVIDQHAAAAMVVAYRVSRLTAWLVRTFKLVRTDRFSLPNALAGEKLVPEAMQEDCTPENLAGFVLDWLRNPLRMAEIQPRFAAIHSELRRNASECAAQAVAELIESQSLTQ